MVHEKTENFFQTRKNDRFYLDFSLFLFSFERKMIKNRKKMKINYCILKIPCYNVITNQIKNKKQNQDIWNGVKEIKNMKKFTRKEIENVVKELNLDMTEKHELEQEEIVAFVKDFIKTLDQCISEKQDITSIIYIDEWKDETHLLKTSVIEILERKWMIKEFK